MNKISIQKPGKICCSPCNNYLFGIEGFSIYKYNFKTKQKQTLIGNIHNKLLYPSGIHLSNNSKLLFISTFDQLNVHIYCTATGKLIHTQSDQFKHPIDIGQTPNSNYYYVIDNDTLKLIDLNKQQNISTIFTTFGIIFNIIFHPNGKSLLLTTETGLMEMNLHTLTSKPVKLVGHIIYNIQISNNNLFLYTIEGSSMIRVYNLHNYQYLFTQILPNIDPLHLIPSSNGKTWMIVDILNNNIHHINNLIEINNFKIFTQSQIFKYSYLSNFIISYNV